ncbi:HNH endonuclease [Streptomyces lydicus]|uniref:HNH endonuclease n=1 Tax=Streptomyces lydicus TaxID=47763 RepID=UPI0037ABF6D4
MWSLPAPALSPRTVYSLCISKSLPKTKARLHALEEDVVNAADRFEAAAAVAALHTLGDLKTKPCDMADRDELRNNYTQRMSSKKHPARAHYDQLRNVPSGRCPLCGHRDVETLDHQLPKADYPLLAVVPTNLVPACRSCNTLKSDSGPESAGKQTLHPYFDDIGDEQWLFARVHEVVPAAVTFFVTPPKTWDSVLTTRVRWHFKVFNLAELYAAQAAREMGDLRYVLKRKAPSVIGDHLKDEAEGRAERSPNHWRTAMFQALASSSWYIGGGFVPE